MKIDKILSLLYTKRIRDGGKRHDRRCETEWITALYWLSYRVEMIHKKIRRLIRPCPWLHSTQPTYITQLELEPPRV